MKTATLKVGIKDFQVEVEIELPESLSDCRELARGNEKYIVSSFIRGYRIDLQEGGARQGIAELLNGKSAVQASRDPQMLAKAREIVLEEIRSFDPEHPRERGGRKPAKPQVVIVQDKQYSAEEVKALLAGLKNVVIDEA